MWETRAQSFVSEREGGLEQLRVRRIADREEHIVAVPDPVYSVWVGENAEYETTTIRYGYSSLVRPTSAFDYDLEARTSTLVKQALFQIVSDVVCQTAPNMPPRGAMRAI